MELTNIKTGITFSAFDLHHAGHVRMLEEAKLHCDYLIVGLQTDSTISPNNTIHCDAAV
ncbi:hypothetical protein FLCH110379_10125 [Flavobacterium chungbukense]|uniref:Cytidyltransferase-like domain-containing protein n=1 Tax=Flavobacterium chungbukense TaxID=877464 RepID=A0ABP7XLM3_9FLAO